ncbi:MAG: DUF1259 domain-containing protein [Methylomonas sp.]
MKTLHYFPTSLLLLGVLLTGPAAAQEEKNQPASLDTAKIDQLTGMKGSFDPSKTVFKVMAPRADLKVTVADVHMTPPMGLTSWAGFMKSGTSTLVMGDMVLLEDQVSPVMDAALDNGLEVTALHNHFLWENAHKVMFMHIGGMGDQEQLASAVGKVFAKIKESGKGVVPRQKIDTAKSKLAADKIEAALGSKGEMNNGIYKASWGRTTQMHDATVGGAMGVNTWAAFAGSDDKAVVDGDFVVHEDELQPVLKALRTAGIHVVAIHQHMIGEQPRMIFLHYWGQGSTTDLAKGIKTALDKTKG